jgi:hypothetical protein
MLLGNTQLGKKPKVDSNKVLLNRVSLLLVVLAKNQEL